MTLIQLSTPRRYWLLAALALLGIIVSALLSQHFYELRGGTGALNSYCNLGKAMNCDIVGASRYAELIWGLPLSSFAAGWYLAFLIIALTALIDEWRAEATRALIGMAGLGLILSVVYFAVMAGVIGTYCINCLLVDGVNIALFLTAWTLRPQLPPPGRGVDFSRWKTLAGVILGSVFIAVVLLKQAEGETMATSEINEEVRSLLASPVIAVKAGPEFPSIGPKAAPITVVEFSDFQCPFCRLGAVSLHAAQERYPAQVRIVFRHFPLDSKCNRGAGHSMHPFACEAAKVAACADEQGKFEAVYNSLFDHQASFADGKPTELAIDAGADAEKLKSCIASPEANLKVTQDVEEGLQLSVESTPTFFVNGHRENGVRPANYWTALFDQILAGAK